MFISTVPDPDFTAFARQGCEQSFRRLVARHLPAVQSAASRVLGAHAANAADVAQAVFILLAKKAATLPPAIIVPAWLHRQTVRLALNVVRSESRRLRRESAAHQCQLMNTSGDEDALWLEIMPHLDSAMLQLPAADRDALALRYLEKRRLAEVGEVLGVTTDAAQKRVERALQKLRVKLSGLTKRALPITAVGTCIQARCVEAAPAALVSDISTHALSHVPGAGFFSHILIFLTQVKLILLGAAAGVLAAGAWVHWGAPTLTVGPAGNGSHAMIPSGMSSHPGGAEKLVLEAAASIEDIFAQALQIMEAPDTEVCRQRLRGLLGQLSSDQLRELTLYSTANLPPYLRRRFHPEMTTCWERLDPAAAIETYVGYREQGGFRMATYCQMAEQTYERWHARDQAAARKWLLEHQNDAAVYPEIPTFIAIVAKAMLKESESSVVQWAAQLSGKEYQLAALRPIFRSFEADGKRQTEYPRLFAIFAQQIDQTFAMTAAEGLFEHWSSKKSEESGAWMATLPPDAFGRHMAKLALRSPHHGDRAVWQWLRRQDQATAAGIVSNAIVEMKYIPWNLLEGVKPFLNGPEAQSAIFHAAKYSVGKEGAKAKIYPLQWAVLLTDPSVRDPMIYGLYQEALNSDERSHAEDFPTQCGWPPGLQAILLRAKSELTPALK